MDDIFRNEISELMTNGRQHDAVDRLSEYLTSHADDDEALFMRGKAFWKLGNRSKAMSDYSSAAAINADSPAATALLMARDIEDFFNRDLYNP